MAFQTTFLETPRLILRQFNDGDAEAVLAIYGDRQANVFLPWFPLETKEEARALLEERYLSFYQRPQGYRYAVCLKEGDTREPVGYVHLSVRDGCDLGYGFRHEFWGRGIAPEAAKAVLGQARADGLAFVTATHDVNNPRSGAVMRRLGLTYRYSYEELWQPKNIPVIFRMYQLNLDGDAGRVYQGYWDTARVRFVEREIPGAHPKADGAPWEFSSNIKRGV